MPTADQPAASPNPIGSPFHSEGHAALCERRTKRSPPLLPNAGPHTRPRPGHPPAPTAPRRPSPSSSRWMMLSMFSLSISAIASQRPGGPLPAAPLPPLAARLARLLSSRRPVVLSPCPLSCPFSFFPLAFPPRPPFAAALSAAPARNKMAAFSSVSLGERMDTTSARRHTGPFIGGREARGEARCALRLFSGSFRRRAEK